MPIIKSAKKKMKQDIARRARNTHVRKEMKQSIKTALQSPSSDAVTIAYKRIDVASKKNVIHPNKAARLKSAVARNAKH
jgi:small subunit ribosomal protein S20